MEAKTTPLVPMVAETEPGPTMPMPTAPAPWSPAPATTGVPAARPVAAAPSAADAGADLGAFEEAGKPGHGDAGGFGDFGGPAAVGDVEQEGSAGLLHVDGELAGEAVADVVLGAEDVRDAGEDFRLVGAHPEELGEGEVGQGGIAGELDEAGAADFASSQSHSGWVRWSAQMRAGRRTLPSASSMTQPCIWPVRPMDSIAGRRIGGGEWRRRWPGARRATSLRGPARPSRYARSGWGRVRRRLRR